MSTATVANTAAVDSAPDSDATPGGISHTRLRVVVAVFTASLVACLYYAIDRSIAFLIHGAPDPLSATASHRIDYFWRVGLSAFIACIAGSIAYSWSRGHEVRVFGWLVRLLVPVCLLCALLGAVFP